MHEPENESITPNPDLESDVTPYSRKEDAIKPLYAGTGRTLAYALAKAVDDALGLPDGRVPGDNRPIRKRGEILEVVRWEVRLGNGHVPDHITYLG
jgi:glyoxylase-like metal-dependent hydrolase (beta-lactamase superfamily II)